MSVKELGKAADVHLKGTYWARDLRRDMYSASITKTSLTLVSLYRTASYLSSQSFVISSTRICIQRSVFISSLPVFRHLLPHVSTFNILYIFFYIHVIFHTRYMSFLASLYSDIDEKARSQSLSLFLPNSTPNFYLLQQIRCNPVKQ